MKIAVSIIMMPGKLVRFGNVGCGWQVGFVETGASEPGGGQLSGVPVYLSNHDARARV